MRAEIPKIADVSHAAVLYRLDRVLLREELLGRCHLQEGRIRPGLLIVVDAPHSDFGAKSNVL